MPDAIVRYKGAQRGLTVSLIRTWHRADADMIDGMEMSTSSGPKDYAKNRIHVVFDADPAIDAVSMVRAGGPPFLIIRKGMQHFDVSGKEVEVQKK